LNENYSWIIYQTDYQTAPNDPRFPNNTKILFHENNLITCGIVNQNGNIVFKEHTKSNMVNNNVE
jgi:hypothetical protein